MILIKMQKYFYSYLCIRQFCLCYRKSSYKSYLLYHISALKNAHKAEKTIHHKYITLSCKKMQLFLQISIKKMQIFQLTPFYHLF